MDLDRLELAHHGVKGMKWGVRREKPSSGKSSKAPTKLNNLEVNAPGGGVLTEEEKDEIYADLSEEAVDALVTLKVAEIQDKLIDLGNQIHDKIFGTPSGKQKLDRDLEDLKRGANIKTQKVRHNVAVKAMEAAGLKVSLGGLMWSKGGSFERQSTTGSFKSDTDKKK